LGAARRDHAPHFEDSFSRHEVPCFAPRGTNFKAFAPTRGIITFRSMLTGNFMRELSTFTVFMPARKIITFIIDAAGARHFLLYSFFY